MSRFVAILLAVGVLVGCNSPGVPAAQDATNVTVWHDVSRHVTCWIYRTYYGAGISCLPDKDVVNP